jgi:hypothetical protein
MSLRGPSADELGTLLVELKVKGHPASVVHFVV